MNFSFPKLDCLKTRRFALPNENDPERDAFMRSILPDDVDVDYVKGLNDEDVRRWISFTCLRETTIDEVRSYVSTNHDDPNALLFGLFIGGRLRGTVRLHDIDTISLSANTGILIFDKSLWGKAWGLTALKKLVEVSFDFLPLRQITAGIDIKNFASLRLFEKAGFETLDGEVVTYSNGVAKIVKIRNPIG